jgi:hypothetical protein
MDEEVPEFGPRGARDLGAFGASAEPTGTIDRPLSSTDVQPA